MQLKEKSDSVRFETATLFKCKSLLLFWSRLLSLKGCGVFFDNDF